MNGDEMPETDRVDDSLAGQQRRWQRWQERYARSSRRTGIQARIVAVALLAGIAMLLIWQFLAASRIA